MTIGLLYFVTTVTFGTTSSRWSNDYYAECVGSFEWRLELPPDQSRRVAESLCTDARIFWPFVEVRNCAGFARLRGDTARHRPITIRVMGASAAARAQTRRAITTALRPEGGATFIGSAALRFIAPSRAVIRDELIINLKACESNLTAPPV